MIIRRFTYEDNLDRLVIARDDKDWKMADKIKNYLLSLSFKIMIYPDGAIVMHKTIKGQGIIIQREVGGIFKCSNEFPEARELYYNKALNKYIYVPLDVIKAKEKINLLKRDLMLHEWIEIFHNTPTHINRL